VQTGVKKIRLNLLYLVFGAFVVALLYSLCPREPAYQGKLLSVWLRDVPPVFVLEWGFVSVQAFRTTAQDEAAEALRHIGTNAVPHFSTSFGIKTVRSSRN